MAIDSKKLVRRHYDEVWSQGKFDGMDELYARNYSGLVPLVGKVDRDSLRAVVGAYRKAFPDLRFDVQEILQDGERLAVRWRASGTNRGEFMGIPATGTFGQVDGLSWITIRDGRIGEDVAQMDELAFFQQMGLKLPVKPGAGVPAAVPQH